MSEFLTGVVFGMMGGAVGGVIGGVVSAFIGIKIDQWMQRRRIKKNEMVIYFGRNRGIRRRLDS